MGGVFLEGNTIHMHACIALRTLHKCFLIETTLLMCFFLLLFFKLVNTEIFTVHKSLDGNQQLKHLLHGKEAMYAACVFWVMHGRTGRKQR